MAELSVFDRRLLIVTGKGGVGKSVVATAAALVAADRGRRTLLVELTNSGTVGDRLGLSRPLNATPRRIRRNLSACRLDPREALEHFVRGLMPAGFLARRLLSSQSFQTVAAAAPGIDEFLALYRLARWEEERSPGTRRPRFDRIVVDALATGHSIPLLSAPETFLRMVPVGTFARLSQRLRALVTDPRRTSIAVVSIPEEMAVNEATELYRHLEKELRLSVAPPIMNAVLPRRLSLDEERMLCNGTRFPPAWEPYAAAARFELARLRATEQHLGRLHREIGVRPLCLPYVFAPAITVTTIGPIVSALAATTGADGERVGSEAGS